EYLLRLMEDGEFQKCISLAEQLLLQGGLTVQELATVNMALCRARLGIDDPFGAIPSGSLAVKLARDVEDWDLLARSLLNLGHAYLATHDFEQALFQFYSLLESERRYVESQRFVGAAWKGIGICHQHQGEHEQALVAFRRSRAWFQKNKVVHGDFTCIHDLVNTYLDWNDVNPKQSLDQVKDLLKEERAIALAHPTETYYKGTYLYDKGALYLRQRRYKRAIIAAMQAMETHKEDHELTFHVHMVLHACTRELGMVKDALGYALAARVEALAVRRFDLEYLSIRAFVETIRQKNGPAALKQLDTEYQAIGVDLSTYLPQYILQRDLVGAPQPTLEPEKPTN
ncbi:MAG: tetratricopeptide repeat protein, partial [Mycobacterium leprae]